MTNGELSKEKTFKDFVIPDYILKGERTPENRVNIAPRSPMLIFINTKSGGQQGSSILEQLRSLPNQVFKLPEERPNEVLHKIFQHLEKLISEGDHVASDVLAKLRIVVAGGDGTHGWLLGTVADLSVSILPPIATIPLGTGNNLPFSFGWGKKNPGTDMKSVHGFLQQAVNAKPMSVDRWYVCIRMSKLVEDSPLKREPALEKVSSLEKISEEDRLSYHGSFWNYLSLGMDAQVSYEFHTQRKEHPEKFNHQLVNQTRYARISCAQGWFCAPCSHPKSRNITSLATIYIAKKDGKWQQLQISSRIRSIVLLNLPSFSGGLDPWGDPGDKKSRERGLTAPFVNDELLEVVGFRDGWHGMTLLLPNSHGTRLAQAHKLRIVFNNGASDSMYMRVDGEPWIQPLPRSDEPTVVEILHRGKALVLATANRLAKSISTRS
ncbi:hypothetical protein O6H91_04G039100 [Diphasiastrum complanatum]|uniref:Uncharacterized protein n=1 Tax=Diphasiastrum complanatum TaxID=34168 RepID=A0ACC2DVZ6_DIPCM|nr:hypothetical protein O6H91_04G039100 [Diphasiastrum complanatum]